MCIAVYFFVINQNEYFWVINLAENFKMRYPQSRLLNLSIQWKHFLFFYYSSFFGYPYCIKVTFDNNYRYDAISIGLISD